MHAGICSNGGLLHNFTPVAQCWPVENNESTASLIKTSSSLQAWLNGGYPDNLTLVAQCGPTKI